MKRILAFCLLIFGVMLSGCDTIDTKVIKVNLGGSRNAPVGIDTAHVAVFTYTSTFDGEVTTASIGKPVATGNAAVSEGDTSNSISLVVPANMDLYFLVIAPNTLAGYEDDFYIGEAVYKKDDKLDIISLIMKGTTNYSGENTQMIPEDPFLLIDQGFSMSLNEFGIDEADLAPYLEVHFEESSDNETYTLTHTVAGIDAIDNADGYPVTGTSPAANMYYRARIYMPSLGIYFYEWDSVALLAK